MRSVNYSTGMDAVHLDHASQWLQLSALSTECLTTLCVSCAARCHVNPVHPTPTPSFLLKLVDSKSPNRASVFEPTSFRVLWLVDSSCSCFQLSKSDSFNHLILKLGVGLLPPPPVPPPPFFLGHGRGQTQPNNRALAEKKRRRRATGRLRVGGHGHGEGLPIAVALEPTPRRLRDGNLTNWRVRSGCFPANTG